MNNITLYIPVVISAVFGMLGALWAQSKRKDKDEFAIRLIETLAGAASGASAAEKYAGNSGIAFTVLVSLAAGVVCGFVLDAADELIPETIRAFWKTFTDRFK